MNVAMPPQELPLDKVEPKGVLNSVPAWGSYLYQNFLLPALSPNIASEWLNLNTPFNLGSSSNNAAGNVTTEPQPTMDYFSQQWAAPPVTAATIKVEQQQPQAGGSNYYQVAAAAQMPNGYYYNNSAAIATSLLMGSASTSQASSSNISPTVNGIDLQQWSHPPSPQTKSYSATPIMSPKMPSKKRRASSMDSEIDHLSHDEHEVPEGVERDGMIWGMKVEDYRALSARERKRVRNRISARTFRAKRKEHLTSLESTISNKDLQIKLANEEAQRLRQEVLELKRRLAKYEK